MKRPKSKVYGQQIISRNELEYHISMVNTIKATRDKALLAFLFLTGARISEIVRSIRKYDLNIEMHKSEKFLVIYNVKCLKRKPGNIATRNIPINIEREKQFLKFVFAYTKELKPEEYLFKFSRQAAYNVVRKFRDELFPHYFRHLRLTDLTTLYGFNSAELRQFTGWTDDKPAAHYVHLNWRDTADKMLK